MDEITNNKKNARPLSFLIYRNPDEKHFFLSFGLIEKYS